MSYLEEHYRKERSEAGFRVDKKFFGCGVTCRREREERGVEGRCSASGSDATCSTRSSARIPFHRPQIPDILITEPMGGIACRTKRRTW
ncbi:MAG: hypothetical protein ACP5UK_02265, partial [Conexivisphaera sp.]